MGGMKLLFSIALSLAMFWLLPLPESLAALEGLDAGNVRLGLVFFAFIACLWMTEALPLAITALLVPVLGAAMGLADVKVSLASFASPLIFLFFGGFALAAALSSQGLDRWLAGRLATMGKGRFLPVCLWLFGGTAFLSMWMSNTATAAMMLPLAVGVLGKFDSGESGSRNGWFLLLGLAYAASIGGLGTIVGSPPNGIAAKQIGVTFSEWMKIGIPAVVILLPAMVATLWLFFRPTNLEMEGRIEEDGFEFTRTRWITLAIFSLTALAWMFSAKISAALGIASMDTWIALVAVILLAGTRVVSWAEIEKGTDWGVLFLFGGGLALSGILGSSGVSLFLARVLGGAVEGWPLVAIIAAVVCFVIFLTELSSNTASAALLVPIFFSMAGEFELGAAMLVLPIALSASCAFMLPVGTPPNAIVYATGRIPQKQMLRVGLILNLLFVGLITGLSLLLL